MKLFIVATLPRSRSAWLANLFTVPPICFCHHDLGARVRDFGELIAALEATPTDAVGYVDTGLAFLAELRALYPSAPVLTVRRGVDAIETSLLRLGFDDAGAGAILRGLARGLPAGGISWDRLDDEETMIALWRHLVGTELDLPRYRMLSRFNVQVQPELLDVSVTTEAIMRVLEKGVL